MSFPLLQSDLTLIAQLQNPAFQTALAKVRADAKVKHEKARKAAAARGRKSFPLLPFESTWAFEEQFRREFYG